MRALSRPRMTSAYALRAALSGSGADRSYIARSPLRSLPDQNPDLTAT